jgi:hypothetical protein
LGEVAEKIKESAARETLKCIKIFEVFVKELPFSFLYNFLFEGQLSQFDSA